MEQVWRQQQLMASLPIKTKNMKHMAACAMACTTTCQDMALFPDGRQRQRQQQQQQQQRTT